MKSKLIKVKKQKRKFKETLIHPTLCHHGIKNPASNLLSLLTFVDQCNYYVLNVLQIWVCRHFDLSR